jgi:hypothetical protein
MQWDEILALTDQMRVCDSRFVAEIIQRRAYKTSLADPLDGSDAFVVIQPLIEEVVASVRRLLDAVNSMVATTPQAGYLAAFVDGALGSSPIGEALGMALETLYVDDPLEVQS